MPIPVDCPKCGKKLAALEELVGKKIECPVCQTRILVAPVPKGEDKITTEVPLSAGAPAETATSPSPTPGREKRRALDEDDDRENRFRRPANDGGLSTLIPYKNGKALAAYYCGVFGIIPVLGLFLGPLAFLLGFLGFRFARAHPQAKGMGHAIAGMILGMFATIVNWGPTLLLTWLIIKDVYHL